MSKIKLCQSSLKLAALTAAALFSSFALSQTIADIADAQRAKLLHDVETARPTNTVAVKVSTIKKKPVAPVIKIYAIYTRGGHAVAEVTDGRNLFPVEKWMTVGKYRVKAITSSGVDLVPNVSCKKHCPKAKTVSVGGVV